MVIKIIGMLMIIVSGIMTGFDMSGRYVGRINELNEIRKTIILLSGEVRYNNSNIKFAMQKICKNSENIMTEFFTRVIEKLNVFNESDIYEIWSEIALEYLGKNSRLNNSDIKKLTDMGEFLGITDRDTQIKNFELYLTQLQTDIEEAQSDRENKCKLYRTVGTMAGMLISVIMI